MIRAGIFAALLLMGMALVGCGTVKEKTAPCKRPANLSAYAEDPRGPCAAMRLINDPVSAFEAIGVLDQH
ncbi:hypothetical protein [Ensifer sp. YR511]|uniref:hypothetical protein n=1 Tax=Ensifer sp. YR511 TaxID=1855294 RepID=UPI000883F31D|nr:hypothetical protein [Ensifer sp. YR511]SDN95661.1 hypothetical protein SAMN05216328_14425 [Ensifer sp. YR511]